MRRSYHGVYVEDQDQFIGVNLGSDFAAEHEWGIKDLNRMFGVNKDDGLGMPRRRITKVPDDGRLIFAGVKGITALVCRHYNLPSYEKLGLWEIEPRGELYPIGREEDTMAWDEGSFGLASRNSKHIEYLTELYDAIMRRDLLMFLGGRQTYFDNAGLCLMIASRTPDRVARALYEVDFEAQRIKDASNKVLVETNLEWKIHETGKSWFALAPRWTPENKQSQTKYPVMYLLNPVQQDKYEWGIYTVEELEQWVEDKGPVMKKR